MMSVVWTNCWVQQHMFTASGLVLLTVPLGALETSCSLYTSFIQALLLHGSLPEDEQTSTLSFGDSTSSEQQLVIHHSAFLCFPRNNVRNCACLIYSLLW